MSDLHAAIVATAQDADALRSACGGEVNANDKGPELVKQWQQLASDVQAVRREADRIVAESNNGSTVPAELEDGLLDWLGIVRGSV